MAAGGAILLILLIWFLHFGHGTVKWRPPSGAGRPDPALLAEPAPSPSSAPEPASAATGDEVRNQQRRDMRAYLRDPATDVTALLGDCAILGDYRACGFLFLDGMDESRVLASYGESIRGVESHMEELLALDPKYIFLCYGLNDMREADWDTPESYAGACRSCIRALRQQLPEATVFFHAIFPCTESAVTRVEKWTEIPDYNAALEALCREEGCVFVSADPMGNLDPYYDEDGIHFTNDFYRLWAENLLMAIYDADPEALPLGQGG